MLKQIEHGNQDDWRAQNKNDYSPKKRSSDHVSNSLDIQFIETSKKACRRRTSNPLTMLGKVVPTTVG